MFKNRQISELKKTEIVHEYLNDQLLILCANHDSTPEIADEISRRIVHVNEQLSFTSKKLQILRSVQN